MPRVKKTTEENGSEGEKKASTPKGEVTKITFKTKNISNPERVFTEAKHGEDFAQVADEFEKSNEGSILERIEE